MSVPDFRGFADEILNCVFDGGDWDGGALQDWAVQCGLLVLRQMVVPCGEVCGCAEVEPAGQVVACYRKTYDMGDDR